MLEFIAAASSISGVAMLYIAWLQRERNTTLVSCSWLMLCGSLPCWSITVSGDKGVAIALTLMSVTAFIILSVRWFSTQPKDKRAPKIRAMALNLSHQVILRRCWMAILIVPLGLLAALAVCTSVFMLLQASGGSITSNVTVAAFTFPLVWAVLAVGVGYFDSIVVKTAIVGLPALLSGCLIGLLFSPILI